MGFQEMKKSLANAYDSNVQIRRMQQLIMDGHSVIGDAPKTLSIPTLSGLPGIGKSACVKEFAMEREFEFIELDCSYMTASAMATFMYGAIQRISAGQAVGCVLLINNIDEADDEWRLLFDQYANNYFDAVVNVVDEADQNGISKLRHRIDGIPEGVFIVGEQRPY
jgi:hypothetical protein